MLRDTGGQAGGPHVLNYVLNHLGVGATRRDC